MGKYQAFDPNCELTGETALSFTTNINHKHLEDILEKHGLNQIDPQQWYCVQSVLDVMSDLAEEGNATSNFVAIGMTASELGLKRLPDQFSSMSLFEFFAAYDAWFRNLHRNGEIGYTKTKVINDNHLIIRTKLPYPDDLIYGAFYAYARHFTPEGKTMTLRYDEDVTRRENGGEETIFHIRLK